MANNPFSTSRVGDQDVRVLRSAATQQNLDTDRPQAVQYVAYNDDDFTAVAFNRAFALRATNSFEESFTFWNATVNAGATQLIDANKNIAQVYSPLPLFRHVRDYLYRDDNHSENFEREGLFNHSNSSYYESLCSPSLSASIELNKPLWLINSRSYSPHQSSTTNQVSNTIKIMTFKDNQGKTDLIQPGSFNLKINDNNFLRDESYVHHEMAIQQRPALALGLQSHTQDFGIAYSGTGPKTGPFDELAGSGFTLEIVFRPYEVNSRQTLFYKGGVLDTTCGSITSIVNNIYEAGNRLVAAGTTALQYDQNFMSLSTNPNSIFYESWQGSSAGDLFAGREVDPTVDFLRSQFAPAFSEIRVDLLSPTSFEIQVGDGDLTPITSTSGEVFGTGGNLDGGTGSRFSHPGASATFRANSAGLPFNLTDGRPHHLILSWSPTSKSHHLSSAYATSANNGSYSGYIQCYLDGMKLKAAESISSAQYSTSGLFLDDPDSTLSGTIPALTFNAGGILSVDEKTEPERFVYFNSARIGDRLQGIPYVLSGTNALVSPLGISSMHEGAGSGYQLVSETIREQTLENFYSADGGSANGRYILSGGLYNAYPTGIKSARKYEEECFVTSSSTAGLRGSQYLTLEDFEKGFPLDETEEFTVEIFLRTSVVSGENERSVSSDGHHTAGARQSETGTLFAIGGLDAQGEYKPNMFGLDLVNKRKPVTYNVDDQRSFVVGGTQLKVNLFNNDAQGSENEHTFPFIQTDAYPTSGFYASMMNDSITAIPLSSWPFAKGYQGRVMTLSAHLTMDGDIVYNSEEENLALGPLSGAADGPHNTIGTQGAELVGNPIYKSTPYIALSYSSNSPDARLHRYTTEDGKTLNLGAFYSLFVAQDMGLSAAEGIMTGDYDKGKLGSLTGFGYSHVVDSTTAGAFYPVRKLNFKLPELLAAQVRATSPLFVGAASPSGELDANTASATEGFLQSSIEEIRIWKKALTQREMRLHSSDRAALFDRESSAYDPLTPDDLVGHFTFSEQDEKSNFYVGARAQRRVASPNVSQRKDLINFPRLAEPSAENYFNGEILELRGWVGQLSDPFASTSTSGSVMAGGPMDPNYRVATNLDSGVVSSPNVGASAFANEVGLSFRNMGGVYRNRAIQRTSPFVNGSYLPLANYEQGLLEVGPLNGNTHGRTVYDSRYRSPKTNSLLAFWYQTNQPIFYNSMSVNYKQKMWIDEVTQKNLQFYNEAAMHQTGFISYKDTARRFLPNALQHGMICRAAPFGDRMLTNFEQPPVGTVFYDAKTIVFDSTDHYIGHSFTASLDATLDLNSWWKNYVIDKAHSIDWNILQKKAVLKLTSVADGVLFNGSVNSSAYDSISREYFTSPPQTYITTIGFYNEVNELMAVGKFHQPIRKNEGQNIVLEPMLDFSPVDLPPQELVLRDLYGPPNDLIPANEQTGIFSDSAEQDFGDDHYLPGGPVPRHRRMLNDDQGEAQ